jgi:hypothetical protein
MIHSKINAISPQIAALESDCARGLPHNVDLVDARWISNFYYNTLEYISTYFFWFKADLYIARARPRKLKRAPSRTLKFAGSRPQSRNYFAIIAIIRAIPLKADTVDSESFGDNYWYYPIVFSCT